MGRNDAEQVRKWNGKFRVANAIRVSAIRVATIRIPTMSIATIRASS